VSGTGTALLDFGAFPGASDASLAITGQAGIVGDSLVECWVLPADTTDHLADEHRVETLDVYAGAIVAGTGFTIYGTIETTANEPSVVTQSGYITNWALTTVATVFAQPGSIADAGGLGMRLYGKWNVAWAWV
jgi:hypothetical protein